MVDKYATSESQPQLENMSFFFLPFFPPFLLETGSHYVAQAEHKLTELSLCLPQPGKLFHFYTYATSQYFTILFSHSNRVLSMNTTQLIFLLGKK